MEVYAKRMKTTLPAVLMRFNMKKFRKTEKRVGSNAMSHVLGGTVLSEEGLEADDAFLFRSSLDAAV